MQIVTIEQVKAQVQVDHALDDELLEQKADAAEAAVTLYLENESPNVDIGADVPQIVEAVLNLTAILYRYRDDPTLEGKIAHGFLPFTTTMLLYPLREPTLA
jgi:hypothetical protein